MSKTFRSFLFVFAAFVQILHFFNNSNAQNLSAKIKIDSRTPSIASVTGKNPIERRNLSFLLTSARFDKLGERISEVHLFDEKGEEVPFRRFVAGEYVAERDFYSWSYKIDLTPSKNKEFLARISWLTEKSGILILDDMLPHMGREGKLRTASIQLELPQNWRAVSSNPRQDERFIRSDDVEKSVIFIGENLFAIKSIKTGLMSPILRLTFDGKWDFSYDDAMSLTNEICLEYQKMFGSYLYSPEGHSVDGVHIAFIRFPGSASSGGWEADSRGQNITLITSDAPFKSQSLQQLHEQLRHEIFHLWIPNGVNLSGHYDWFYEGFALYQSLKTGVALNRIRFDDYLDTLSRAYEIDKGRSQKVSLIDASKNRWVNDNNTYIYARGMLVAFMCDVALLEKSKGKRSVTDVLRKLYESHRPPNPETDGNTAVFALLRSYAELTPITDRNITGAETLDWSVLIKAAGLEADPTVATTNLKVTAKPSGRQKDLLDKLGYNNWRKLASK